MRRSPVSRSTAEQYGERMVPDGDATASDRGQTVEGQAVEGDATRRTVLQRSVGTEHALTSARPALRGWLHLVAAAVSVPAGIAWVVVTDATLTRAAIAAFAGGIGAMFTASSLLHIVRWSPAAYERMLRLDHTAIYLAISGTGVALGLLGFPRWAGAILVLAAVTGALLGIVVEWFPFAPPRGYSNTMYLTLGWMPIVLLPWLWRASGPAVVGLLVAGGGLYTLGAIIVGMRRPDPWPRWFGYHELFHLLVIIAVACHAWMFWLLV